MDALSFETGLQTTCYIDILPDETLVSIFDEVIKKPKDLVNLSLVYHRFKKISSFYRRQKEFEGLIPSYFKDSDIGKLPIPKQLELAENVENNLLNGTLKPTFTTSVISGTNTRMGFYTPEIIFKNHFIFANLNKLNVFDIHTKHRESFEKSCIQGLQGIDADRSLLAVFFEERFEILDFESLKKGENTELLKYDYNDLIYKNFVEYKGGYFPCPVTNTFKHLLAIAFKDYVSIIDFNNWSEIRIKFLAENQIQFTDTHLMLVSEKEIRIYEMSALFLQFEQSSKYAKIDRMSVLLEDFPSLLTHSAKQSISFAKMNKDRVVLAYQTVRVDSIIGEVINLKTKAVTLLHHPDNDPQVSRTIRSIDFFCQRIFTSSSTYLCEWSFDRPEPIKQCKFNDRPISVQIIGKYALVFFSNKLTIVDSQFKEIKTFNDRYFKQITEGYLTEVRMIGEEYFAAKVSDVYDLKKNNN